MFKWPDKNTLLAYIYVSLKITVVFTILYGFSNWLATQRTHTYELWMLWELQIPLVPWMIVIYGSLNILTLLPLFTMTVPQIQSLGRGMLAATCIAAVFFLLFPAHLGYVRTTTDGFWRPAFELLFSLDQTANTVPSLHITYSYLVVRATTGLHKKLKPALWLWFFLIACSVLLIRQHHVIDLFAGVLLAEACHRKFFSVSKP